MGDWYLGEIRNFAFQKAPVDWTPCNGQLLNIQQNSALYALIGTTYGGNGTTTFGLPDLRGRVGLSQNPGVTGGLNGSVSPYARGAAGGTENVTLTPSQLPAHDHSLQAVSNPGTTSAISPNYISSAGTSPTVPAPAHNLYAAPTTQSALVPLNPGSLQNAGGNGAHSNMQPFLVTNYCIATTGLFPPRN